MLDIMFIIIVLIFIAIIIRASMIKIVPILKPVKTPAIRIENIMKDADDMEYPISDEEFEEVKWAYGTTEGPSIGLAISSVLCLLLITIFTWEYFGLIHKVIYIFVMSATIYIWFKNYKKNKSVFTTDRDWFRKKTAYLLDDDVKTFYAPRYSGGHFRGVNEIETYKVMVGVMDDQNNPCAYVIQTNAALYARLKKEGNCEAILYKGKVSGFADLKYCPNVSFQKGAKNLVKTGFGLNKDKGDN